MDGIQVFQMIVTVLIFVVGVTLNGLVVWVLGFRKWRKSGSIGSETQGAGSFRIYVVNLALADLMLIMRTPVMLGYLVHDSKWPFGKPVCQFIMFLRCLGLYVGAFLLSAIALERCLCILRPVWARMRRPHWVVPLVCILLWALASALSVPYITAAGLIRDKENRTHCIDNVNATGQTTLLVLESVAGFLLPLVIFLSCNVAVIVTARRAESGMSSVSSTPGSPTSPTGSIYTAQRLTRLYRILFFTMLLFLTCWVPYFTCRFLKALAANREWKNLSDGAIKGIYVALFLVYFKCTLNPILYVFAARGLSRTFRASLLSTIERVFNEDLSESLRRKSLRRKDSQI